jgi:8-oxo-dGTP diphosphatase
MTRSRFCSACGGVLDEAQLDGRARLVCRNCGRITYSNPIPSVAAIIEQDGAVLLVQRAVEPGKGRWCLPGGFIETGESIEDAVVREVKEETGLDCQPLDILDARSDLGGYYGDILIVCYRARVLGGKPIAGDDAMDLGFFQISDVPPLAFRSHRRLLERFWDRALMFPDSDMESQK